MDPNTPNAPMMARGAQTASGGTARPTRTAGGASEWTTPAAAAKRILGILDGGDYVLARDQAAIAAERFPDHPEIRKLRDFFDPRGKAHAVPGGPGPGREKEFAWLKSPPDSVRGRWVALVGDELVAVGDSLKEVTDVTRSRTFDRRPLVHRVD